MTAPPESPAPNPAADPAPDPATGSRQPRPETVEILRRLIGYDTTSRNSNLALIDWVADYLTGLGARCERFPNAAGDKASLWATFGPEGVPGWVLSGHTDTVPVDGQDWSGDPFTLRQEGGRLYGRGSCDMKDRPPSPVM